MLPFYFKLITMAENKTYKSSTSLTFIGDAVTVKAVSEFENNKRMDTQILINDILLCWVSGAEYPAFIEKLQNLVNEFRI